MRIQHNIMAMNAYRNYTNNVSAMKKNLEKLSSGYKINRAGDDAAGLAISEKMRAQITGLQTAQKNAKDGISLVQTAEGALTEVHDMLNRMVELATQSANGTYDNTDRTQLQKEVNQLLEEIDRIADSSNFNGINLLDGTLGLNTAAFEVGESVGYTAEVEPQSIDLSDAVAGYHGGEAVTGQAPKFVIDLNDIEITNAGTAATKVKFKITIGSGDSAVAIEATSTDNVAVGSKATATQIQKAIKNALDALATGATGTGAGAAKTLKVGDLYMKYTVTGTSIAFEYDSVGGTKTQDWATAVSGTDGASKAATFNEFIGKGVTVEPNGSDTKFTAGKTEIHALRAVKNAVADQPAARPGVDIDIASLVKDGYKLSIASGTDDTAAKTTYIFKTDKDSDYSALASTNTKIIDVSMVKEADQARQAALIIAGGAAKTGSAPNEKETGHAAGASQTANIFKIGIKEGTKLHIDVAAAGNATKADSEDKMRALITATDTGASAVNASTKLKVTESSLKEGNVLSIGGKKITVGKDETADTLAEKITAAGFTTTVASGTGADLGKQILTIQGAAKDADGNDIAAADRTGPMILGKGLTLQIGDTSDDFNQLNVAVQDMHAVSLGLKELKINTEESAQKAIQTIKDAINTVSDVRGTLGATQNRLDHTINNLSVMTENIQDAESTIRDTDVAEEMMAYTKNNILIQSAQAMLAQANQVPQGVLQLLG